MLNGREDPGPPKRADTTRVRNYKTKVRTRQTREPDASCRAALPLPPAPARPALDAACLFCLAVRLLAVQVGGKDGAAPF